MGLKMNLGFFGGGDASGEEKNQGVTQDTAEISGNDEPVDNTLPEGEKKYTDKDVDRIIGKKFAAWKAERESEMAEFNAWKDSQKTESQKQEERIAQLEAEKIRLAEIEQENIALKNGVDPKYMDFILFKARKEMEKGVDFQQALEATIGENEAILKSKNTKALDTGMYQTKTAPDTTDYKTQHKKALESGDMLTAISIKMKAAKEGIYCLYTGVKTLAFRRNL